MKPWIWTKLPEGLPPTYPGRPRTVDTVQQALSTSEQYIYDVLWTRGKEQQLEGERVVVILAGYYKILGLLYEVLKRVRCLRTVQRATLSLVQKGVLVRLPKAQPWHATQYVVRRYENILRVWRADPTIAKVGDKPCVIGRGCRFVRPAAACAALGLALFFSQDAWGIIPRAAREAAAEALLPEANPAPSVARFPPAGVLTAPAQPRPPPPGGPAVAVPSVVAGVIHAVLPNCPNAAIAEIVRAARRQAREKYGLHIPDDAIAGRMQVLTDRICGRGGRVFSPKFYLSSICAEVDGWCEARKREQEAEPESPRLGPL